MRRGKTIAVWALVCVACLSVFAGAGYFIGSVAMDAENKRQLEDLNRLVLGRSELEIDFAFIALGELVEAGAAGCDESPLSAMRRQVYVRSTIKDIRVIDAAGAVKCSAFPETQRFDAAAAPPADRAVRSRVASIELFRLDQVSSVAVGVLWRVVPDLALIAVLNTDALLFGAIPSGLRGNSAMVLSLTNGDVVAAYGTVPETTPEAPPTATFTSTSDRYPLSLQLSVGGSSFSSWNRDALIYFVVSGAVLGLVVRRQIIWRFLRRRLAECRARPGVDVMRRACGAASGDARWCVA